MTSLALGDLSGAELVHFLNAVLSFACSFCIFLGLWPFKGLFHAWLYKHVQYNWAAHTMMAWFDVGCIGLLTANVLALRTFTNETSKEAHEMVYSVNLVMHFLWGLHNFHLFAKGYFYDKGTENEFRRLQVIGLYSLTGACGTGAVRNFCALTYGPSDEATTVTWIIEWASLAMILLDLCYHLAFEHSWGMAMRREPWKAAGKKAK